MQKLGLETFSLFSSSTVKNPNFSEFHISLIIENAQVDFKSEISELSLQRYLQNNTGGCLFFNFIASARVYDSCARICARIIMKFKT